MYSITTFRNELKIDTKKGRKAFYNLSLDLNLASISALALSIINIKKRSLHPNIHHKLPEKVTEAEPK